MEKNKKKKWGRPQGYVVSDETKKKISDRVKQAYKKYQEELVE